MSDPAFVYKILGAADWAMSEALGQSVTALDARDGYVHLSTRAQVGETLRLHYAGQAGVRLLEFVAGELGDVRFEPSRGGQLFPHLYGTLTLGNARRTWTLDTGPDGVPALPGDL